MKARPRRKARTSAEPENENEVDVPVSPSSSKENISPPRAEKESRSSPYVHQQQYIILLIDFDNNVKMAVNEILTRYQQIADSLTLPFLTALISSEKLPTQYKNMKWGDYLKMRDSATKETSSTAIVPSKSRAGAAETNKLTVANNMKITTPALRSSSRLAKKLPPITPKFDPSTPFTTRMPKIGETLVSINGSPVGMPAPTPLSVRGAPTSGADEKDLLVALLSNQDTLANALKDKRTRPGLLAALKNAGKYVGE